MSACNAHASHIVDSRFFRGGYATEEAREIFCDLRRLQRWLEVEVALAESQAELGMIPAAAAVELARTARLDLLDTENIRDEIQRTCHSLLPLLSAWQKTVSSEAGRYIHFGATTQDIQDTALSLEIRDVITIIGRDLHSIAAELITMADRHRSQVIIGRTHGQHALPMTFGLKVAGWLDELLRNIERLDACSARVLVSQLFGGVGTMDAFGERGQELLQLFSNRLGLAAPLVSWHAVRDRQVEFLSVMALTAGSLARIANEIYQLARDEIAELEEPFHAGKIGSSTMPHKRNPEFCEQVVVLSRLIKKNAALGFDSLVSENERDYRAVRLEWVTITDSSLFLSALTGMMQNILRELVVHGDAMQANLEKSATLLSTEALMFLIGKKIGKQTAHQILYDFSMQAHDTGEDLVRLLLTDQRVAEHFTVDQLKKAVDPARHTGLSDQLINRVINTGHAVLTGKNAVLLPPCPLAGKNGACSSNKQRIS